MKEIQFIAIVAILIFSTINFFNTKKLIMNDQEILEALEQADQATNEIAADIQILIDNKQVSQEVADKLTAHVTKLKGIAAER